jgi:UDP-N-acetylmuramyl pentapeptide phosphotransferase/UDP-N-acetylglucosamine-1-phosphate transferase
LNGNGEVWNSYIWLTLALVMLAAFLLAAGVTRRFLHPRSLFHILDNPNARSLHYRPIPRSGGLAFLFAMALVAGVLALAAGFWHGLIWVAAGVALLAAVGTADDLMDVSPLLRLALQTLAAALLIVAGLVPGEMRFPGVEIALLPVWGTALTLGYVVWMTNLYNFMDGMDGFAGGMAVIGFTSLAALALPAGDFQYAAINGIIAAAVAGFLIWNFPPARIFMGDAGSSVLGYLAAAMTLWGAARGLLPLLAGIILFSPFIIDATFTLGRRALRGERVWEAHREHLYQRLVQAGWGHRKTLLRAWLLMAVCAAVALSYSSRADALLQWLLLIGWAGLCLLVTLLVMRKVR